MSLKLDKVDGVVLMKKDNYNYVRRLFFSDKTKIKIILNGPTLCWLETVQKYLNNLCKCLAVTEAEQKQMRPISAQLGSTYGLPEIHKSFTDIPKFCLIVDTTITPYYKIRQYLSSMLQPITICNYTIKDFFDVVNNIKLYHRKYFRKDISLCHLILSLYSRMYL